jgi:hypothetical protein
MENKTDILDRITPEEIEAWLLAAKQKHRLSSISLHALDYTLCAPGIYWAVQASGLCGTETALMDSLLSLREQEIAKLKDGREGA